MKKVLESLIFPKSKDEFFNSYLSNSPFVVHDLKDSISELTALPFLQSIETLLGTWPDTVDAYVSSVSDEAIAERVSTSEAAKRFKSGMGLIFNDANKISPLLSQWLGALRKDMGLSEMTYGRNLIYATKAGNGTAPHFDQNMNFVIQIHGTKKWWLSENENVKNPMTRHVMGQPIDGELSGYATEPMPTKMPADATEVILKPGSMLFVPRGSWHSTEAVTDALALNFTFSAPAWIDIFTAALRSRLSLSPEWRQTADFVSDKQRSPEAAKTFNTLLSQLSDEAPGWQAEDIIAATEAGESE